jgi:signal transduction histidine kinase/ligand-binding sensor domain-containing protein
MLRRVCFLALVLATSSRALALDASKRLSGCTVDTWRSRDGLPGAWVRAIVQTSDGYLWLGTQGGLARYGGGRMVTVQPERTFEEAADVMGLHAARDGALWVLPGRGAPVCLRAGVYGPCFGDRTFDSARVAGVDEEADGTIWIASTEGIHRVRGGRVERVHPASVWGDASVTAIHHDRWGRLWVGTSAGLLVSKGGSLGPADPPGMSLAVTAIVEARDHLWVAGDHALVRIDRDTTVVAGNDVPGLRRTTRLVEDRDGNVWVGTRGGLVRYQPGRGFETFTRADGLPDDDVTDVFEDREGSLWVGTHGGGLAQFTDRTLDGQRGPPSLRDHWISSVAEDSEGTLWVGTALGLTRWKDGHEQTFTSADGLPSNQVLAVLPGRDGVVWAGTEKGLGRWRAGRIDVPVKLDSPVSSLLEEDVLWMGTGEGLARLEGTALERIPPAEGRINEIRGMARDDRGTMWVSAGGRLYTLEGGKLVRPPAGGPQVGKVRSLFRDPDGTLWLGTRDGLVRVKNGVWRTFGPAEGLERADLYQVLADDRDALWAGASTGLLRISRASIDEVEQGRRPRLDVRSFDVSDQGREVGATRTRQPSAWKGRDGRLWFATQRGVVSVDPARMRLDTPAPSVLIEEAVVDGRRAVTGITNVFPPGSGALEFHFAAITLLEPHKAQHRYRLEGFEDRWVEAGTRRVAYYTNVKPGRYRFRVQGSNADGVWNETGDALAFTLAPHFHQTWFFYVGAGLAVLGLVLAFHRMRLAQVHGRYIATFAERTRMARELHDSLLQGMSGVLMRLRAMRKLFGGAVARPTDAAIAGEITEIEEVVTTNIEDTRRLLWDLRGENRGPVDLGAALARLAQKLGGARGVDVRPIVEGTPSPLPQHVSRELLLITQEAITNALEHAAPSKIDVCLHYQPGEVSLTITDDGQGFDPAAPAEAGHFGLQGMRERAAGLGTFSLESRPGGGTRIAVRVSRQELHDG